MSVRSLVYSYFQETKFHRQNETTKTDASEFIGTVIPLVISVLGVAATHSLSHK